MGTVAKRGKNSWRISTRIKVSGDWQWVRMTLHMDPELPESVQRREAERELAKLEKHLAGVMDDTYTVRQWSEIWLEKHLDPDASPVTVHNYRQLLKNRILPQLGDMLLTDLTPVVLTDWFVALRKSPRMTTRKPDDQLSRPRRESEKLIPPSKKEKPLSNKTAINYYACMKTMLAAAVRVGILDYNPMDRVKRPKKKKKQLMPISEARAISLLHLILTEAPEPLQLSVLLAMICSLRLGEVCALTYSDVNWFTQTITVNKSLKYTPEKGSFIDDPKTESSTRVITLPQSLYDILQQDDFDDKLFKELHPEIWKGTDQWYIVHNRYGQRVNKDTPSRWFREFADAHGFKDITFHDLRHVHASILVANNIDIAAIAARMGHSDPSVTLNVYTHAMRARDQDAANTLERLLHTALHPEDDQDDEDPDPDDDDLD